MSSINNIRRNKLDQYIPMTPYTKLGIRWPIYQATRFTICPRIIPKSGWAHTVYPLFVSRGRYQSLMYKRISLREQDY